MSVLVVDDDANLRRMLRAVLEEEGYPVDEAPSAEAGLQAVTQGELPEVVLLDLVLPGMSGLDALPRFQEALPGVPVVLISGQAGLHDAVRATREGAFHFLEKPLSPEAVFPTVRAAVEVARARDLSRALQSEMGPGTEIVGRSSAMAEVRDRIRRVASTEARVLITGESGTGKELAAGAIHGLSERRGGPFVRVNSAALPPTLLDSELFGHERGAFTGADRRRRGRFEIAHTGTLFLDEVADLTPDAQAKLLRTLESGQVERVGGQESVEVDVRVLAATNRDLRKEVGAGSFREDLLYRLEVVPLRIPPLRERKEDIPELLEHARERLRHRQGLAPPGFTPEAVDRMAEHPWPGNVRELFNIVERLAILHPQGPVTESEVASVLRDSGPPPSDGPGGPLAEEHRRLPLAEALERYERGLIQRSLEEAEGNVAEAARRLQTDRANLYRRMKRLGIHPGSTDAAAGPSGAMAGQEEDPSEP